MGTEASLLYLLEPNIGSFQSQFNPDYALEHYFKINFYIRPVVPSMPVSPHWPLQSLLIICLCMCNLPISSTCHAHQISFNCSSQTYMAKNTNSEALEFLLWFI
jgi:hypothetical protein